MKNNLKRLVLLTFMLCVLGTIAKAQTVYQHTEGGIQFTVPKYWKVDNQADSISIESPDGQIVVMFFVSSKKDIAAAAEAIVEEIGSSLDNITVNGEGEELYINGLQCFDFYGTGKVDGIPMEWNVVLINAKKPTVALIFGSKAGFNKYRTGFRNLISSIKPIK